MSEGRLMKLTGVISAVLVATAAIVLLLPRLTHTPVEPKYIGNFRVVFETDTYRVIFSLYDEEHNEISGDGEAVFTMYDEGGEQLCEKHYQVESSDFERLTFVEQEFLAHEQPIPANDVATGYSSTGLGRATLEFIKSSGGTLSIESDDVRVPSYTGEEMKRLSEEEYQEQGLSVDQVQEKGNFRVSLTRLGHFNQLEFGTWGKQKRVFRVDLKITNTGNEDYFFIREATILDDKDTLYRVLRAEFDQPIGGGTLLPEETMEGHVIFQEISPDAKTLKITIPDGYLEGEKIFFGFQADITSIQE